MKKEIERETVGRREKKRKKTVKEGTHAANIKGKRK
jgi:hypothetical protein